MNAYRRSIIRILVVLLLLTAVGSRLSLADQRPRLRVVHAATGLQNIDIYVNDLLFFDNILFQYISDYTPVDAGERTIKVRPAGVSPEDPTMREVTESYNTDQEYTIIVAGRVRGIEYWRLTDDNSLPGDGTSKVRIVHASISTPTAEFCLGDVCRTLAFKEASDYFLLDPGLYQPHIRLNGVEMTTLDVPPLELKNNSVHTVFMIGQLQDQPTALRLLYTLDAGEYQIPSYPQPFPPGASQPPGVVQPAVPPPAYPPVTGAFLSTKAIGILVGGTLILLGCLGLWLARR
ncbi:MAG: DUF4397 domain-containing protein [Anaerolineaceae bacterium]|nr:DUF4397 domain-containing protein [Anaerolineaceae bacterium]MCB9099862.1 DUF4397 domain-containing protein [Anaerolineales bacterium]